MKIKICTGAKCMFYGGDSLIDSVTELAEDLHSYSGVPADATLEVEPIPCDQSCKGQGNRVSPVVFLNDRRYERATGPMIMEKILNELQETK